MNAWTAGVPRKAKAALVCAAFVVLLAVVFAVRPFGAWADQSGGAYLESRGADAAYETLSAALADAADGDVVHLHAGDTPFGDVPFVLEGKSVLVLGDSAEESRVAFSSRQTALTVVDARLTLAKAAFVLDAATPGDAAGATQGAQAQDAQAQRVQDSLVVVRGLSTFELGEGGSIEGVHAKTSATSAADNTATAASGASAATAADSFFGAVRVEENSEFVMKEGSRVAGFAARAASHGSASGAGELVGRGAAAYIGFGATFIMEGGAIEECSADEGGALYVEGSATLAGGAIRACEAQAGPAAYVAAEGVLDEWGTAFEACVAHREQGAVCRAEPEVEDEVDAEAAPADIGQNGEGADADVAIDTAAEGEGAESDVADEEFEADDEAAEEGPLALAQRSSAVCRVVGGASYDSLQKAIDAVATNGSATIEMLVGANTITKTVNVNRGKTIVITTAPNVSICTFTLGATSGPGLPAFKVFAKASLTLDGTRNGKQGVSSNGIVVQGGDRLSQPSLFEGKRGIDVNNGTLVLKDATIQRFAASFGGTAGVKSVGINANRAGVSLEGTSSINNCKMIRRSAVKEDSGGITVFGSAESRLFMGPETVVSDCTGVTGGVAVNMATADIRGTITRCNSIDGVVHRGAGGLYISDYGQVTLNDATITNNRFSSSTPNTTPSAGGAWLEDGRLTIHGATITGNVTNSKNSSNPNAAGGVGMSIELLAGDPDHTRLALSGKVVIKDNRVGDGRPQTNLTLAKGGVSYMHYLMIDGDLEPGSYVGITAQAQGNKRYLANEAFAASALTSSGAPAQDPYQGYPRYTGDAKALANLNCLVNDRNPALRGSASPAGWKSPGWPSTTGQAYWTLPPSPAAIIWATGYTLVVKKTVVDPTGSASGSFVFEGSTKSSGISGIVYASNGTPTGQVVKLSRTKKEFTLSNGQYVRFSYVTNTGSSQTSLGGITIREKDSVAASTNNPTVAFVCKVTAKAGSANYGSIAAASDGSAQWSGGGSAMPPNTGTVTVTFANTLRTGPLRVTKSVSGDFADATKAFPFTLTLHVPSFVKPGATFTASELDASGVATGATYSFASDVAVGFSLRSGHTLAFDALPVGTTYDLAEQGAPGYYSSAEVSTLGANNKPFAVQVAEGGAGEGLAFSYGDAAPGVASAKVAYAAATSQANKVQVTNRLFTAPPTGVEDVSAAGAETLVATSAAAVALLAVVSVSWRFARRRRAARLR